MVAYSPLYSPASLGAVERQHRDLKQSLKATLLNMAEVHKSNWMAILPWTLLARRTAYHSELQASPAEFVFGDNPSVPGDLQGADIAPDSSLANLLERLRENAKRPSAEATIRRTPAVHYPPTTQTATHIYLKNQKSQLEVVANSRKIGHLDRKCGIMVKM